MCYIHPLIMGTKPRSGSPPLRGWASAVYRDRSGLVTRVSGHREDVSEDVDCFDYWLKRSESVPTSLCGECVTLPVLLSRTPRYRGIKS